jgi:hypothetical protein
VKEALLSKAPTKSASYNFDSYMLTGGCSERGGGAVGVLERGEGGSDAYMLTGGWECMWRG